MTQPTITAHLRFLPQMLPMGAKTRAWTVTTLDAAPLGTIKWYGRWRRYCFWPGPGSLYDHECLTEIGGFCAYHTRTHRERQR